MNFSKPTVSPVFNPILALLVIFSIAMCGCDDQKTEKQEEEKHFHVHGPHTGGECFRFDENEEFACEIVLQGQNNVVRVLFTDYDGKKKMEFAADSLTLKRAADDENGFELTAVAGEEDGKLAGFELDNEDLKAAIAVAMVATITVGDKEFTGKTNPGH